MLPALLLLALPALQASAPQEPAPREGTPPAAAQDQAAGKDAPAAPPAAPVALVGGTVHSLVPGEAPRVATVLVEDGKIRAVGPDVEVPAGVQVVDATGKHVVPGLIDAMVGFDPAHDPLYLKAGITLVRDIGSGRARDLDQRRPEVRDAAPGPALLVPIAPLDGDPPTTPEAAILRDPSAADALLPIVLHDRPDYLSLLENLSPEVHAHVISVAHEKGLQAWGPIPRAVTLEQALAAGQDGIFYLDSILPEGKTWTDMDDAALDRMVGELRDAHVAVVPAIEAGVVRLSDQSKDPEALALLNILAPGYERWWRAELGSRAPSLTPAVVAAGKASVARAEELLHRLDAAGVRLVPGSAAPNPWLFPGNALLAELARWVEAGLAPADVLARATRGAAEALGVGDQRGTIAPGKVADLLVVDADPEASIQNLRDPAVVVLRGRAFERERLDRLVGAVLEAEHRVRAAAEAPIEVSAPDTGEGKVVLSGHVESVAVGQRIGAERFAVVRRPDGTTSYVGHLVNPPEGEGLSHDLVVRQDVKDGQLVSFTVQVSDGEHHLVVEGVWSAGTFRIRHSYDGLPQGGVTSTGEHVVALDLGSVTSLLILARIRRDAPFPMLTFHEGMIPETVNWQLAIDSAGDFHVGTPLGPLAFRLDEHGAPVLWRRVVGQGIVEVRLLDSETGGGPGHPLTAEERAWVQERQQRASAAEADAREAGAGAKDGSGGDPGAGAGSGGDEDGASGGGGGSGSGG